MKKAALCLLLLLLSIGSAEAKRHINLRSEEEKKLFDYYYYEALRAINFDQVDSAVMLLSHCISIDPSDCVARRLRADMYVVLQMDSLALEEYRLALLSCDDDWTTRKHYLQILSEQDDKEDYILRELRKATKQDDKNTEAWTMLAQVYMHNNQHKKAIAALDKLESLAGIDEYTSIHKFQRYTHLGKDDYALRELDRLIKEYPYETRYRVIKANFLLFRKDTAGAYSCYQEAKRKCLSDIYLYQAMVNYYEATQQYDSALVCLYEMIASTEVDIEAKVALVEGNITRNNKTRHNDPVVLRMLFTLIDAHPDDKRAYIYYARMLYSDNQLEQAFKVYQDILYLDPQDEEALHCCILIALQENQNALALRLSEDALQKLPQSCNIWLSYGYALTQNGDYQQAIDALHAGRKHIPQKQVELKAVFMEAIANAYHIQLQADSSIYYYEQALALSPDNARTINNLAYALCMDTTNMENIKRAERLSQTLVSKGDNYSVFLDTYAWALYLQGRNSLALIYMRIAINNLKKEDDCAEIWQHYSLILHACGRIEEALKAQEEADKRMIQ